MIPDAWFGLKEGKKIIETQKLFFQEYQVALFDPGGTKFCSCRLCDVTGTSLLTKVHAHNLPSGGTSRAT